MMIFIVIVLVFIGFIFFSAYTKSVKRIHYVDSNAARKEVSEGKRRLPSWYSPHVFTNKTKECLLLVVQSLKDHGYSEEEVAAFLKNNEVLLTALYIAGQMEIKGSSFFSQKVAVSEFFIDFAQKNFLNSNMPREKRSTNEKMNEGLQYIINTLIEDIEKSPKMIDSWSNFKKERFKLAVFHNPIITNNLSKVDIEFLKNHPTGEFIYIIANALYDHNVTDNDKVIFITAMTIRSLVEDFEYDFMYRLVNKTNS